MRLMFGDVETLFHMSPCALTFGNFDGVHRGHQAILSLLKRQAAAAQLPMVVLLFEPQPQEYFEGRDSRIRLTTLRDKLQLLSQAGVDTVYCVRFNASLAACPPAQFIQQLLFTQLQAQFILIGEDARFGARRLGNAVLLSQLAVQAGKQVQVVSNIEHQGERISSTMIREALQQGQFDRAEEGLGRPYSVFGRVVYGRGLGRQLGAPTLNLYQRYTTPPLRGVYAVQIIEADGRRTQGVANWGTRPSIDGEKAVLEVHGFQLDGHFYGQWVQVQFLRKLRSEQKFDSLSRLMQQIQHDVAEAKAYFSVLA